MTMIFSVSWFQNEKIFHRKDEKRKSFCEKAGGKDF